MTYAPLFVDQFGGLNLRDDPSEVGFSGAIDLLNVDVDPGRLRTRDGLTRFSLTDVGVFLGYRIFPFTKALAALADRLIVLTPAAGTASQLTTVDENGLVTVVGTWPGATHDPFVTSHTLFGNDATRWAFVASRDGDTARTLQKFDGTTLAASVGKPKYVATWKERLVQANYVAAADTPSGANGSSKTLFFSDPGTPETFTATNWVKVQPLVGEIMGLTSLGDYLLAFGYDTVYIFYSTSTDQTGGAIFEYRQVALPEPMRPFRDSTLTHGLGCCTLGPDGVYVILRDGLYRVTPNITQRISDAVRPIFDGTADSTIALSDAFVPRLEWCAGRLLLQYTADAGNERVLVWDPARDAWLLWSFSQGIGGVTGWLGDTYFFLNDGYVYKLTSGQTSDNGTAIASSYQSGLQRIADGGSARLRRFRLTGTGTVNHATASDFGSVGATASVTLGTAPTVAPGYDYRAARARDLSYKLSASSGAWSVNRWETWVADVRNR